MRRIVLLVFYLFVMLCMFAAPGSAGGPVEGKVQNREQDPAAKVKEVSLYLYYQKYLNPYLNKDKTKTADKGGRTEPRGLLASNPSSPAIPDKPKAGGTPVIQSEGPGEAGKKDQEERTFMSFNRLESIGLDAVNKIFPQEYRKEYLAEVALGVRLTPQVDLSVGKVQKFERSGDSPWGAHDDGWRLKLQKHF